MDAYAKAGFRAVELWLESVEPFLEKELAAVARRLMSDHGVKPVSSCCEEDLFFLFQYAAQDPCQVAEKSYEGLSGLPARV